MPELPEIETIKLQLQKHLIGQVITKLEKLHPKSVQGDIHKVAGKKITSVRRFGKMLALELTDNLCIAIHFKMTGQLVLVTSDKKQVTSKKNRIVGGHPTADWVKDLPSKHTRAIFHFKSGDKLYFNDQRLFGWIRILANKDSSDLSYLKSLGPEVWNLTDKEFQQRLIKSKRAIKLVLMDQGIISGAGNIYANDALWEAKIHPSAPANQLNSNQVQLLKQALIKVLQEGIKFGGATAADDTYINLYGMGGTYQKHFRVYAREGEACQRADGGIIKKIKIGGRGSYFCPKCQILSKM